MVIGVLMSVCSAVALGEPQPGGTAKFADALTYKLIKVEMVRPFLTPQQTETMQRTWGDMLPRVSYLFLTELPERVIEATELNLTSVRLADGMALREEQVRQLGKRYRDFQVFYSSDRTGLILGPDGRTLTVEVETALDHLVDLVEVVGSFKVRVGTGSEVVTTGQMPFRRGFIDPQSAAQVDAAFDWPSTKYLAVKMPVDPKRVADVEVVDADGKVLPFAGPNYFSVVGSSADDAYIKLHIGVSSLTQFSLRVMLYTETTLVDVPFRIANVKVPPAAGARRSGEPAPQAQCE